MSGQLKFVPSMATVSLKEVLDIWKADSAHEGELNGGYSTLITSLSARGSRSDGSGPDFDDDDIGVRAWMSSSGSRFKMDYSLSTDAMGMPMNPLTDRRISKIHDRLTATELADAAVTEVSVLFYDESLGDMAGTVGNKWHMTFESQAADGDRDRSQIDAHQENVPLIEEEGFKYYLLNLRRLVDYRQMVNQSRTERRPQFIWEGETFDGIHNELDHDIRQLDTGGYLGKYGFVKRYGKDRGDTLVLLGVENSKSGGSP